MTCRYTLCDTVQISYEFRRIHLNVHTMYDDAVKQTIKADDAMRCSRLVSILFVALIYWFDCIDVVNWRAKQKFQLNVTTLSYGTHITAFAFSLSLNFSKLRIFVLLFNQFDWIACTKDFLWTIYNWIWWQFRSTHLFQISPLHTDNSMKYTKKSLKVIKRTSCEKY